MALIRPPEQGYTYYKQPNYPDVPFEEYVRRISKAQRLMSENNINCLVLWSKKNMRYFFGFQTNHWLIPSIQPAVGVIPEKGEPVLIVPQFFRGTAECQCWIRNIWSQKEPHQPKSERELPSEIARLVMELGYGNKKIGWESGPLGCMAIPRPVNDIKAFEAALTDAELVDGDQVIWGCRMIKSPLEVERISKSVEAVGAVEVALVDEFRPGMSETDLSIIVQRKAAELGIGFIGDSIGVFGVLHAASGKEVIADIGIHENAKIDKNDSIVLDLSFDYKGYCPDSARIFQVGPITDRIKHYYELIWEGEDRAEAILRPGISAKELWEAMYEPIRHEGLPLFDMGGHGVGLDQHEPPSIDSWNEMIIQEGMVLSIEPWLQYSYKSQGGEGKFGIQDQFVVTAGGCEKIEGIRRDIIQVAQPFV